MNLQRPPKKVLVLVLALTGLVPTLASAQGEPPKVETNPSADPKARKITGVDKTQVARGGAVVFQIEGSPWPDNAGQISISLGGKPAGTAERKDAKSFTYRVPQCPRPAIGLQTVGVTLPAGPGEKPVQVDVDQAASRLDILPEPPPTAAPKITGVFPIPSYPGSEHGRYELRIQGEGFSPASCLNEIYLDQKRQPDVCWEGTGCEPKENDKTIDARLVEDGRAILLSDVERSGFRSEKIAIGISSQISTPVDIRLSRVGKSFPLRLSLLGAILLFLAGFFLAGLRTRLEIGGKRIGFLARLVLDPETETYSLSKLQFLIWTFVAVLAYLYMALSSWLVQGKLDFADIPGGLPGIVFISAATTILAQWTQGTKGPKGAGAPYPTATDFVTVGGVVAPERFQFFIWTILGALAYLTLTFLRDPGSIHDLPRVPDGFLQLMGISSAGYLGGKLVRKPGPVITDIKPQNAAGQLTLTILGRNLSTDATFRLRPIVAGTATTPEILDVTKIVGGKPTGKEPEGVGSDPTFVKVLELKINAPKPEWTAGEVELTLVNPDGQYAAQSFKP